MKEQMTALAAFQTKIRAIRVAARNQRMQLAEQLIAEDGSPPATYPIALALSALLRDSARTGDDWKAVLAFLRGLPEKFRTAPEMREHGAFAGSQAGNTTESIAERGSQTDHPRRRRAHGIEVAECMVRRLNAREKFRMKEGLRQCMRPLGGEFFSWP